MLVRFVVDNFLSFGSEVEFNMLVGNFRNHKSHIYDKAVRVLRSAAIYGSNGAGKSNLIKAIEFLTELIENNGIYQNVNVFKFKLNSENAAKPINFEIELIINSKVYVYGVSLNGNKIVNEWLFESGLGGTDVMIFERISSEKGVSIEFNKKFKKTSKQRLLIELLEENLLKPNELLLSKDKELKIDIISEFKNKIVDDIIIIHPQSRYKHLTAHISTSEEFKVFSNALLKSFDTGVNELNIEVSEFETYFGEDDADLKDEIFNDLQSNQGLIIKHKGNEIFCRNENGKISVNKLVACHKDDKGKMINFDLEEESDGTQRLLDFIPAFNGILNNEVTFIIDEIDQSLHPALLKSLITKIMSEKDTKGQLIFTTHESNLLDLDVFRQDEIWFVEKDKETGKSDMYSLSEYKPRYDLNIRKGYLKGRFGAIPFLADLEELNW